MNMMSYDDVLSELESNAPIGFSESFDMARACADMLADNATEDQSRDLIIRALENWERLHEGTRETWNELVAAAGLYPYLDEDLRTSSSTSIVHEYHRSRSLPGYYLHREQLRLSAMLEAGQSLIVSAPTSFGKSLLIQEVIATKRYKNIVIIQPTLALLDETRKKLQAYGDEYNLIVSTHQKPNGGSNIFLFTGERVVEYEEFPPVEFFVIDEFYKLSLARDDERATTLNQALYRLLKMTHTFYMLGPNIQDVSEKLTKQYQAQWYRSNYSTVAVDVSSIYAGKGWKVHDKRREESLFQLLVTLDEPTIIYCSSPDKSAKLSQAFLGYLLEGDYDITTGVSEELQEIIEWIAENVHEDWSLARLVTAGIAFHHGQLPRHLGSSIVDAFNNKSVRWLFCTSTLIEGVNTTARNVVLFDKRKGRKPIDFFDYKNIVGRSGRMKVHFVGKVYEFHKDPAQADMYVEVPLFEQRNAPVELLVQLDKDDIDDDASHRLDAFEKLDPDLKAVIRKNSGLPVEGQAKLVAEIEASIDYYSRFLVWHGYPDFDQLRTTLELCWMYLLKRNESKAHVQSPKQLAFLTIGYARERSLKKLIQKDVDGAFWKERVPDHDARVQQVVLRTLGIARHWFDFKLPKLLSGVSELQEYVLKKHGKEPGNYSYFSALLENDFFEGSLSVLMDYDVPASAIRKLEAYFSGDESWGEVRKQLRSIDLRKAGLIEYESKKLAAAVADQ